MASLVAAVSLLAVAWAEGAGYREDEARFYLQYARAAFCAQDAVESWSCGTACVDAMVIPGSVQFLTAPEVHMQGYVASLPIGGGRCVAAFRGSVNFENYETDLNALPLPWPPAESGRGHTAWCQGCRVHAGFAAAYEALRPAALAAFHRLRCSKVALAGHSLGAALVTLLSLEARAALGLEVGPVYTFGSPRVGNLAFAAAFLAAAEGQAMKPSAWRVVHYHDPVARLPPQGAPTEYSHVGREVYYHTETSDTYRVCGTAEEVPGEEDPTCADARPAYKCITLDHITYLNLTTKLTKRSSACVESSVSRMLLL